MRIIRAQLLVAASIVLLGAAPPSGSSWSLLLVFSSVDAFTATTTTTSRTTMPAAASVSRQAASSFSSFGATATAAATVRLNLLNPGQTTELPDSLEDAAIRAAQASAEYAKANGGVGSRCRIDFDTSIGDETFTRLKQSTEFMQQYVSALCYATIPEMQQLRQTEMIRVATAKAEWKQLESERQKSADASDDEKKKKDNEVREDELVQIIANDGRDPDFVWDGHVARIFFPDEGSAALARRDWSLGGGADDSKVGVPPCVQFSSCGGVQNYDITNDKIVLFFCPRASESDSVETILEKYDLLESEDNKVELVVFVNPNLVDMGVTGFGMAGRRLRERLLDTLEQVYYLRTLPWGALTREWPALYSVWQEDENSNGGYRLISNLDRLPSNPEVEDIYDVENGIQPEKQSGGLLDQFGDFVNGMMKL